ncbi:MAG: glycosyltransferase family 39 protein [Ferruginibacter sp.]|nr:glycosyltransferase family 39 protein [Ferruginibacter sp.]
MQHQTLIPPFHLPRKQLRIALAVIFMLLIGLRLYVCFFSGLPNWHRDTGDYFSQADALLAGGYVNYFPNGLPAIIALLKWITPHHTDQTLLWLHVCMAAGTGWFIYRICTVVFRNDWIALLALLLLAIFPTQVNLTRWLTSEVSSTFFLTAAYYYYLKKNHYASGVLFAFATLIRTEFIFIVGLLLFFELIRKKRLNWRLMITLFIPLFLTGMYCKSKTGKFAIAGHSKVNILFSVTASGENIDWDYVDKHPEIKTEKEALQLYFKRMRNEPGPFFKDRWLNFWEMWGYPSSAKGTRGNTERTIIFLGNILMLAGGLFTCWKNRKRFEVIILAFPFVVITGLHIMMMALQRYVFPAEPFMIALVAYMLLYMLYGLRAKKVIRNV